VALRGLERSEVPKIRSREGGTASGQLGDSKWPTSKRSGSSLALRKIAPTEQLPISRCSRKSEGGLQKKRGTEQKKRGKSITGSSYRRKIKGGTNTSECAIIQEERKGLPGFRHTRGPKVPDRKNRKSACLIIRKGERKKKNRKTRK